MDTPGPSFEASLLYQAPVTSDPVVLAEQLGDIVAQHDLTLCRVQAMDGVFLHADCGAVQLLLAFCPEPLPVEHFLEAARPTVGMAAEQAILRQLTQQSAHLTILVLDHPDDPPATARVPAAVKRALCLEAAELLTDQTEPELVFWGANDTLYTADEFLRRCDFFAAQTAHDDTAPTDRHAHLRAESILPRNACDWLDSGPAAPPPNEAEAEYDDADADLAQLTRGNVELGLAAAPGGWNVQRTLRGLAMACSGATIGLSGMANFGGFF